MRGEGAWTLTEKAARFAFTKKDNEPAAARDENGETGAHSQGTDV